MKAIRPAALLWLSMAALAGAASRQTSTLALDDVLAKAGTYVTKYERDFAGVVAEETYSQEVRAAPRFDSHGSLSSPLSKRRALKSDLLLFKAEGADLWIQFRDVFEVDGRSVHDRTDRLAKLFLQPQKSLNERLQQIAKESARYNIGDVSRTVNLPLLALVILEPAYQPRFEFARVEAADSSIAGEVWVIDYRETRARTMIRTTGDQDLPARGRFWIEPASGRVLLSTLIAEDRAVRAQIDVTYAPEPSLGLLVPSDMRERYERRVDGATVNGRATYAKFRRFQVFVDEKIAPIK
jgi:hypothetical protein